jgi:hypothetical protein
VLVFAAGGALAAKFAGDPFTLGGGGRALAMGGAVVAGPFDGSAAYWNPAGMNRLSGRYVLAMHSETFGSLLNHEFLSYVYARPADDRFVQSYGFYLYYLGGGGIKITRLNEYERPEVESEESHGDLLLSAALSGRLGGKVDFGLSAKIIYRDIGTESGYGLTVDVGALYDLTDYATLGLMVSDATTGFIRYSGDTFGTGANTESIYPTVKPGLLLEHTYADFTGRFAVSGDIRFEGIKTGAQYWLGDLSLETHYGWELVWRGMVSGRFGFDIGRITAGGGVALKSISVDFAYLHSDDLDETYRVSAGYRF